MENDMKKIFLISAMVCTAFSQAYAGNVYLEANGTYGDYGDAKTMLGYGAGLGYQVAPRINAWFHFLNGSATTTVNGVKTVEYEHMIWYASGEYNYQIGNLPLYGIASLGAGVSRMRIDHKYDPTLTKGSDMGFFTGGWIGARYHLTQRLGLFALAGYQMSSQFQGKLESAKIQGYQLQVGVTATVFGKNSAADDEY
jgi:hypothetical protein